MITFILKFSFLLLIFLVFYKLILENEKIHNFKRFYLLFSIFIALVLPFIKIDFTAKEHFKYSANHIVSEINTISNQEIVKTTFDYMKIFYIIYLILFIFFLVKYLKNIWIFYKIINQNEKIKIENQTFVLIDNPTNPFSFLNFIFLNKEKYQQNKIEKELILHEKIHTKQKHTIDILIIELLKVVFWFNPLLHLYRKAIELNHEFLADEKVIANISKIEYQYLLLKIIDNNQQPLASNWNFLLTKYRIIMMNKKSNPKVCNVKKAIVFPLLAAMFAIFCIESVVAQKTSIEVQALPDKAYYYSKTEFVFKDKNKKIVKTCNYEQLSPQEIANLLPPLETPEKKLISNPYYNSFKDITKFAVWIDGKVANKEMLEQYKNSDFVYFTKSFVYKKARSKRFPQEYQISLYTEKEFQKSFVKNVPIGGKYIFAKWDKK
jgi:beta-lactamase regulating signal transducer with metallopeptidase domain